MPISHQSRGDYTSMCPLNWVMGCCWVGMGGQLWKHPDTRSGPKPDQTEATGYNGWTSTRNYTSSCSLNHILNTPKPTTRDHHGNRSWLLPNMEVPVIKKLNWLNISYSRISQEFWSFYDHTRWITLTTNLQLGIAQAHSHPIRELTIPDIGIFQGIEVLSEKPNLDLSHANIYVSHHSYSTYPCAYQADYTQAMKSVIT